MSSREYGSPYCPEIVGTAQRALALVEDLPEVVPAREVEGSYQVTRTLSSQTREGYLHVTGIAEQKPGEPDVQTMLRAYQDAYPDIPAVTSLNRVYDTEMVPPGFGVELGLETNNGRFFTSTGTTPESAIAEAVAFALTSPDLR